MHTKNKLLFSRQGFTLVEMLVVLGLFSFIMTLATGVLYSTQSINVKLQETQSVLDNVNVSFETVVRDIRYGSNFNCMNVMPDTSVDNSYTLRGNCSYMTHGAGHGGTILFLKPIDAVNNLDRIAYYATTTSSGAMVIQKDEIFSGKPKASYQVTADDVRIKSLFFYVSGASTTALTGGVSGSEDYEQPLVTIVATGETVPSKNSSTSTPFVVETSVSSRVLDN